MRDNWLDAMFPEDLKKSFVDGELPGIETVRGAALRVLLLRDEIFKYHGGDTFRIFAQYAKPATKRELTELRNWELLQRFDAMPEQNVTQFACALAVENKKQLPLEERKGPGGANPVALDRYIRRLLQHREEAMQDDQWDGPVPR